MRMIAVCHRPLFFAYTIEIRDFLLVPLRNDRPVLPIARNMFR